MTRKPYNPDRSPRTRAERVLGKKGVTIPDAMSAGEMQRILHNLQVHQIKLEMQNEELRRTQKELELSRERYVDLYDLAPVGYITLNNTGVVIQANLAAADLLGVTRNMLVGRSITGFIHPDNTDIYSFHRKRSMETDMPMNLELRMLRGNGSFVWVRIKSTTGPAGKCRITLDDISERKMAESAYRRAKEWELTFDAVPDLVAILDDRHQIMRVNRAMADRLHLAPSQCVGLPCHSAIQGTDIPADFCRHSDSPADTAADTTEPRETTSDDTFLITTTPIFDDRGEIYATVHVARDLSTLHQAEEALKRSEETLRLHTEYSPLGVIEWDSNFVVTRWTGAAELIFGWSAAETVGKQMASLNILHEDDIPMVEMTMARLSDGATRHVVTTNRNYAKSGAVRHCTWYNTALTDHQGRMCSVLSMVVDITGLKNAEQERQKFVSLVEHSDEFIGMCDLQLVPFYVNDAALRLVGLDSMEEAMRVDIMDFFYPEDRDFIENVFLPRVYQEGHGETEIRFRHAKTGTPVWMIYSVFYIRNSNGEPVALATVSRDITQRKEFEKRLQEHQSELKSRVKERTGDLLATVETLRKEIIEREKTEAALREETRQRIMAVEEIRRQEHILIHQNRQAAMGEMIGNIAHQWRQPLNTLGLFTQRLGYFYGSPAFTKEFLEESVAKSMEIIQYMSRTIDDFRDFFSTEREKSEFRVVDAVQMALSLVEASFKERKIYIKTVVHEDSRIYGVPNEYAQVLLNIFVNARDALYDCNIESPQLLITIGAENGTSVVTISDNAGGIPEDIIDKIFDPYFTTKGPQQGTGIGLFMSKTIIESSMEGRLTVRNTETGAEFRIEV